MKLAESELLRALANMEAMSVHLDAMDHTLQAFGKQVEGAKHEMTVLRLDMHEVQQEVRAAVKRLQELRGETAAAPDDSGEQAPQV